MTLPHESFNSLRNCRKYLESILKREDKFPKTQKDSVEKAYRLLKHFPDSYMINILEQIYNEKIAGGK